ncbi:unnamed protein product [Eruca vesicaria subsp. sativa]|uniref:Uncharacterized protein n=1 Tax=Eruca vesicaria subsp. sativa TaxID=29727 RepID=A0ABC8KPT3_ERUVS|nr:unnamed protein product [Eruca vesicaria subsp. sativa]
MDSLWFTSPKETRTARRGLKLLHQVVATVGTMYGDRLTISAMGAFICKFSHITYISKCYD